MKRLSFLLMILLLNNGVWSQDEIFLTSAEYLIDIRIHEQQETKFVYEKDGSLHDLPIGQVVWIRYGKTGETIFLDERSTSVSPLQEEVDILPIEEEPMESPMADSLREEMLPAEPELELPENPAQTPASSGSFPPVLEPISQSDGEQVQAAEWEDQVDPAEMERALKRQERVRRRKIWSIVGLSYLGLMVGSTILGG